MTTRRHLLAAAATLAPLALAFKSATADDGASDHTKTGHASGEKADIIGMPLTPVSFAGVGRRSFRRAVIY